LYCRYVRSHTKSRSGAWQTLKIEVIDWTWTGLGMEEGWENGLIVNVVYVVQIAYFVNIVKFSICVSEWVSYPGRLTILDESKDLLCDQITSTHL